VCAGAAAPPPLFLTFNLSLVLFILIGFLKPEATPQRDAILAKTNGDDGGGDAGATATPEPAPAGDAKVVVDSDHPRG
jgi:lipopolysaccharide export LptBFGC system permease protein LptF